jgi:voltage-gated sodium channel
MKRLIKNFVENRTFEIFILLVVILNTLVLSLQTINIFGVKVSLFLDVINKICIGIYVVEAILEIIAWRLSYFKNGWNVFDFIIVIISIIPMTSVFSSLRLFRFLRVLRTLTALRLISNITQLKKIIQAIILSLPGIAWTALLMITLYFIFSIIGINLFHDYSPETFGSFPVAFVTLFSLTTMEGWQDIVFPIVKQLPLSWIYFILFLSMSSYVLLNLIVGIVVDNISNISEAKDNDSMKLDELKIELTKLNEQIMELNKKINEQWHE